MWIFTRYGFYSVSAQGRWFAVRARTEHHLVALLRRFPHLQWRHKAVIIETPLADYRWRILVPRRPWVSALADMQEEQSWPNFKAEAARFNGAGSYLDALHQVWHETRILQMKEAAAMEAAQVQTEEPQ